LSVYNFFYFFFRSYGHNLFLHTFPTRRSSDLMAFQVNSIIIALLSMLTGAIVGEFFRLEDALNRVGNWIGGKFTNTNDDVNVERSEEHTSELQSRFDLVCRLLLEKKKIIDYII